VYHSKATESLSEHPPRPLTIGRRNGRLISKHGLGHAPGPLVRPGLAEKIHRAVQPGILGRPHGGLGDLWCRHRISTPPRTGRSDRSAP